MSDKGIVLDSRIKNAGSLAKEAFTYLNKLQQGEKSLIRTGHPFIDDHIFGLLPSDVILLGANSGVGKTKMMFDTIDQVLDEKVNPKAAGIKSLEYSLEMKFLNRVLRDTNKITKKKKSAILTEEFSPEEKELVKRYYEALLDDRRFICEEPVTTKEFYNMTRDFCLLNIEAEGILVSIDHALLVKKDDKMEDALESLSAYINLLRKEFHNVYFLILSQLNRGSLVNIKDRDNSMIPTTAMIYGSSHFEFLSSYIVVLVDPFRLGVNQYLKVNKERYDWLEEHMTDEDNKGKVSFDTIGKTFVFTLKTRESDIPYKNLHIIKQDLTSDQLDKMKQSVVSETAPFSVNAPTFTQPPVFIEPLVIPTSYSNLAEAFDSPVINEDLESF